MNETIENVAELYQKVTREELEVAYAEAIEWYKTNHIHRDFDKYTECFWILFNDGSEHL